MTRWHLKIYRRYWKYCFDQVYARSGYHQLSEDISQQVFVTLWKKRKTCNQINNIKNYLLSVTRYNFIYHVKKQIQSKNHARYLQEHLVEPYNPIEKVIRIKEISKAINNETQ